MLSYAVKILSGASTILHETRGHLKDRLISAMEDKILKGNYVRYEDFKQLKELVIKLERNSDKKNSD
jgi:hypothetical protein